ncbi:MAG: sodium/proton-translocating pyrophosphatase, partial [Gemmataceae bacterium]
MKKIALQNAKGPSRRGLWMMVAFMVIGLMGASGVGTGGTGHGGEEWHPFSLFSSDSNFTLFEKAALVTNLLVAFAGLFYARWLMTYVNGADNGTSVMQEIAKAVREGAYAYLRRQFTVVGVLIVIIAGILVATKWPWHDPNNTTEIWVAGGRGVAFLMGSFFSALVGLLGMRMATIGNLKVAAAARESFGRALQIGYRSGTVTGMLTDGLGLLGGTTIFLVYGEKAFEVLLGFGFGGTLLALFMRVGG